MFGNRFNTVLVNFVMLVTAGSGIAFGESVSKELCDYANQIRPDVFQFLSSDRLLRKEAGDPSPEQIEAGTFACERGFADARVNSKEAAHATSLSASIVATGIMYIPFCLAKSCNLIAAFVEQPELALLSFGEAAFAKTIADAQKEAEGYKKQHPDEEIETRYVSYPEANLDMVMYANQTTGETFLTVADPAKQAALFPTFEVSSDQPLRKIDLATLVEMTAQVREAAQLQEAADELADIALPSIDQKEDDLEFAGMTSNSNEPKPKIVSTPEGTILAIEPASQPQAEPVQQELPYSTQVQLTATGTEPTTSLQQEAISVPNAPATPIEHSLFWLLFGTVAFVILLLWQTFRSNPNHA